MWDVLVGQDSAPFPALGAMLLSPDELDLLYQLCPFLSIPTTEGQGWLSYLLPQQLKCLCFCQSRISPMHPLLPYRMLPKNLFLPAAPNSLCLWTSSCPRIPSPGASLPPFCPIPCPPNFPTVFLFPRQGVFFLASLLPVVVPRQGGLWLCLTPLKSSPFSLCSNSVSFSNVPTHYNQPGSSPTGKVSSLSLRYSKYCLILAQTSSPPHSVITD